MEIPSDKQILDSLVKMVQKFRDNPHMELEVRLGKFIGNKFEPGVDFDYSKALYSAMTNEESLSQWDSHPSSCSFKYMYYPGSVRATYFFNKKAEFYEINRFDQPLDIECPKREYSLRFALKEEIPLKNFQTHEAATLVRVNTRCSILHNKVWSYDFSKVGSGNTADEACNNITINIELELHRNDEFLSKYDNSIIAVNLLGKARDLLGRFSSEGRYELLPLIKHT